ncbi:DinI family protein [Citrobacter youngae]|uniref:DinI family protein n=1 Tax=Citrobacter youngae TaxID=133448 RepID=UPI00207C84AD|nr:DinI family protein [Citrobacter youngae]MCO4162097.1 DinI family protein [Citrobacter youngae]
MKVELTIDRTKELPKGVVPALEKELLKRLGNHYENCSLSIRRAGSDGLSVFGGDKEDKKKIETILQEAWESADDWFY